MTESLHPFYSQIQQHAESLADGDALADQMLANLTGQRYIPPGEAIESIAMIPVGAVETPDTVRLGHRILDMLGRRVEGSLIALSVNAVGETDSRVLSNAAAVAQEVSRESRTPVTFFAKAYSEQDGRIGELRRELVGATALAVVKGKHSISDRTTLFMGDIDLVGASPESWRTAHEAVALGRTRFAQAGIGMANSQDLQAVGLLPKNLGFPQMDRVLYYWNRMTMANGFSRYGKWNAMTLGDYLAIDGYDGRLAYDEDIDLDDRLWRYTGLHKMPSAESSTRILDNPRRTYARLRQRGDILIYENGLAAFRTVNDWVRSTPLHEFRDITPELADDSIEELWARDHYYGIGRSLANGLLWYRMQKLLGRHKMLEWRMAPPAWRPNQWEAEALEEAEQWLIDFRQDLKYHEPATA